MNLINNVKFKELVNYIDIYNKNQLPASEKLMIKLLDHIIILKCIKFETTYTLLEVNQTNEGIKEITEYLKSEKFI